MPDWPMPTDRAPRTPVQHPRLAREQTHLRRGWAAPAARSVRSPGG